MPKPKIKDPEKIKKIAQWAAMTKKAGRPKGTTKSLTDRKLTCWQLRKLGYTIEQVAQILCIGESTVFRWDKQCDGAFADLPSVQIGIDRLQSLIPKSIKVYEECLSVDDARVRRETARDILNNFRVLTDRKEVTIPSDGNTATDQLIAEAQRIIAITA